MRYLETVIALEKTEIEVETAVLAEIVLVAIGRLALLLVVVVVIVDIVQTATANTVLIVSTDLVAVIANIVLSVIVGTVPVVEIVPVAEIVPVVVEKIALGKLAVAALAALATALV